VSQEPDSARAALVLALRDGDTASAVDRARALAHAGRWDGLVAATLVAHAGEADPDWPRARLEMERLQAAEALLAEPSEQRWQGLIQALVTAGRVVEAVTGVALAWDARQVGAEVWHHLITALLEHDHGAEALAVLRRVCDGVADGELWAMRASLACEAGVLDEADHALEQAQHHAPRSPLPWMARARLAQVRGDQLAAIQALETARSLGAPSEMLSALENLGGVARRLGL